ncbi:DUF559 domain-containing protein [Tomitella gaofuii]|uniref:DUF559 domain-containing protein n=1 Tax=Tomitella gaofuii TaxID=2760083 RepID=UPI0015F82ACC|nr:DUF559 domain-containing protein [Tomitella gaofuii]
MGENGEDGRARGATWIKTMAQLTEHESRSTVARRCRSGRYVQVLRGVYADAEPRGIDRCRAVSLWRADATFSHTTAAWLWGLIDEPELVHVTVPPSTQLRGPGWLAVTRRELPGPGSWAFDLPVVGIARAIVESVPLVDAQTAERIVDEYARSDEWYEELLECCRRDSGCRGVSLARRVVERAARRTASEAERVVARALGRAGYNLEVNKAIGRFWCDLVDEWSGVVVEIDGRGPHSERSVFRNDRRRQNRLVLDGWLVLRYAADDVFDDLDEVVREIIRTVATRRRSRRRTGAR